MITISLSDDERVITITQSCVADDRILERISEMIKFKTVIGVTLKDNSNNEGGRQTSQKVLTLRLG